MPQHYVRLLQVCVKVLRTVVAHVSDHNTFVHPNLTYATHVFLPRDALKAPLTPAYDGPFQALRRTAKSATILQNNGEKSSVWMV